MNITTNQNRQFYLVKRYADGSVVPAVGSATSAAGDMGVTVKNGELWFPYQGAETVLRSDRVQLKNLDYAKVIAAADMVTPLKKVKVTLDSGINSGNPISGQDYELKIHLPGFYTDSAIEDYYKFGIVHATAAMEADKKEFYKAMVKSLNANFSREVDATPTSNPYLEFSAGTSGSEDGIYITAKEPAWNLGTEQQRMIDFEALPQEIYTGGDDIIWGTVTPIASTGTVGTDAIGNGKKIADLEYFCMGERGDQYRNMGWPNVIQTKYLVDPTQQYHVLELHFAFTDTGVNSYRSEKDITIACATQAQMIALVKALQTAAGITVDKSATAADWTWT
jgi:hypothetical protein